LNESLLKSFLHESLSGSGGITVLTGAGISAESGIPTFRGPEGYWSVGSQVYQPQQMATFSMFQQNPRAVWQWYLYRLGVCLAAQPNAGHLALVHLAQMVPERFALITQNVDNLHLQSGQRIEHTFQIHGNICYVRCARDCCGRLDPLPTGVTGISKNEPLNDAQWQLLRCPACSGLLRPHVLWFDEAYNEHYFHLHSVLQIARRTQLLIVVGTSAQTNLPNQIVSEVYRHGGIIIDVNIAQNPFGLLAARYERGLAIQEPSGMALPRIVELLETIQSRGLASRPRA
jgi:NAD-dependent deacetylase